MILIHRLFLCACGAIALLLASCASIPPQQQVRDFPVVSLESIIPPGLSSDTSEDAAFPDFYLMLDQQAAPKMWEALATKLPELLGGGKAGSFPAFDPRLTNNIQRLVVFRPQQQNGLEGLMFGTLPVCPIRAALEGQHDWHETTLEIVGHGSIPVFVRADGSLRLALINDACIAFQSGAGDFEQHVRRAQALGRAAPVAGSDATSDIPGTFAQVLAQEQDKGSLFMLASLGINGRLPTLGFRIRIAPSTSDSNGPVNMRITFLVRDGSSPRMLKTGLKFLLVGLAGSAGLSLDFLNQLQFSDNGNELQLESLRMDQQSAAELLSSLIQLRSVMSGPEEGVTQ